MTELKYPFLDLGIVNSRYAADLKKAASRVIDSGRYIGGCENDIFEKELAELVGVDYAVGVSNGLDALRLIFRAYIELGQLKPGDEVIVPANTYIASVLAITDNGLEPVFVEPDSKTYNIDISLLESAITSRTKAILTVHLYGRVCYDKCMAEVARKYNLLIVEDNAQAIGAEATIESCRGTAKTGSLGNAAAFSFYPTKNIGALGDGGAVTTSDRALAETVRVLANYGSKSRYNNVFEGFNCRLDAIQAAFLRVKLQHLNEEILHRRELAAIYSTTISNVLVKTPLIDSPDRSVWHQYVVTTPCRDNLINYLANNGVGTDIHYAVPPHRQPCYSRYAHLKLPMTEKLAGEVLSLPISSGTSVDDAREIARIINNFTND